MAIGDPTGADLCVGTTDGNTLPETTSWEEREITFVSPIELTSGTKYAIVVRAITDEVEWIIATPSGLANGSEYTSSDSGVTWSESATWDAWFTIKATGVTKDSYNPVDEDSYDYITGANWVAQTFTALSTYTITSIVLKLSRWPASIPGIVTVSIRAVKGFTPPSNIVVVKKLVAAANNKIWYEDI